MADGVAPAQALEINTISMVVLLAVMVGMGWFYDRVGRKPVLLGATAIAVIGALPLFWLTRHPDPALILLGQMAFVVSVGMFLGAQPAIMVEATPAAVRYTAIALGYNVTRGIVGGVTPLAARHPLAAAWRVSRTENVLSSAFLVIAAVAISFAGVLTYGRVR